jgi:hypothetical protein
MYFGGGDIVVAWGIVLSAGVSGVVTWAASRFIYARGIRDVPEPTLVLAD